MPESTALTPQPIMQALSAFWVSAALKSALDLDLFGALADGPLDARALGARIGAPARSTALLADALVGTGFLTKNRDRYELPPVSATFLDPAKPTFFGGMAHIVSSPVLWEGLQHLADAVRNGGSVLEQHTLTPDNPFWHTFAQASLGLAASQGSAVAEALAERKVPVTKILDVAAGTGGYGYSVAARFPDSRVTFADWPGVLEYTSRNADRFGVRGRASYAPGDIFSSDWGGGYDLVLLPNIYHHFDEADCVALSRRVRASLAPGGAVVVVTSCRTKPGHRRPFLYSSAS